MMQQILKRLELIKTSITLEDEEIIELQIIKIKAMDIDDSVADILKQLEQQHFSSAFKAIEAYINQNTGLVAYEDKELNALKLELKSLERQLQALVERKNDCDTELDDFNREYHANLGEIIHQVLQLRAQILQQQLLEKQLAFEKHKQAYDAQKENVSESKQKIAEQEALLDSLDDFSEEYDALYEACKALQEELNAQEEQLSEQRQKVKLAKSELEEDPVHEEYIEAQEESAQFEEEYAIIKADEDYELTPDELSALKLAYRKACKLCHPDIVSDELKDQAHEIMIELNAARKKKDLKRVTEILLALQSGTQFDVASDTIQDKTLLNLKISDIKQKIIVLNNEIDILEQNEEYQEIRNITDKPDYFVALNKGLQAEKDRLTQLLFTLTNPAESISDSEPLANPSSNKPEEDGYWSDEF